MSFLRRILGGGARPADARRADGQTDDGRPADEGPEDPMGATAAVDAEIARERELLLEEARRLDDDLIQRQMRYADRAWTPPAQGGTRRADDEDSQPEG